MQSPGESQSASTALTWMRAAWQSAAAHGFLGRTGGASTGTYATLNLGERVGDDPAAVAANWARARAELGTDAAFARVNQVHGAAVRVVTRESAALRPPADGMVTRDTGVMLAIFTADCVPVLMVSERVCAAAALHAGWRGVIGGIACEGVAAMERLGAHRGEISAALGPSIGSCCFEVDEDLAARFAREIAGTERHCRAGRPGKAYLDLRAIVRDQLIAAGLDPAAIESVGPCTRCAADRFFSRRAAGGVTTGLQMSFVGFAER
jgi:purine-nucleoside/S-methyl-5'-thioadenosine phosphorylase / adenosine deaminase